MGSWDAEVLCSELELWGQEGSKGGVWEELMAPTDPMHQEMGMGNC